MYISVSSALDMMSRMAPRPWCKKLLAHMVHTGELDAFFSAGTVSLRTRAIFEDEVNNYDDIQIDQRLEPVTGVDILENDSTNVQPQGTLVGCFSKVVDQWKDEYRKTPSWVLTCGANVDWEKGTVSSEFMEDEWGERYGYGNHDDGEIQISLSGMVFDFEKVEMYVPNSGAPNNIELIAKKQVVPLPVGRPRKYEWEGRVPRRGVGAGALIWSPACLAGRFTWSQRAT
ncbi:hypothetical protein GAY29_23930 [Azospirillum brasilense]|uniref:hypothetical protein n=1 Tax=Azospirillum brasilense TaxID=192 RepID=UPI0019099235|nr:hypothetical protein [Azospirillum brasilense]MBK3736097.1 hypothetical protein [Azospirillum brasilense]